MTSTGTATASSSKRTARAQHSSCSPRRASSARVAAASTRSGWAAMTSSSR